jgi:pyruvate dehydrogenase E1 component
LRRHFEVDAAHIVIATLEALARSGDVKHEVVDEAIRHFDVDPERPDPRNA